MNATGEAAKAHAPLFTATWLGVTSTLYLALADSNGLVGGRVADALFFVPSDALAAPWRLLVAPLGILVAHDAVQFAYVVALFAVTVPLFEHREGWRRTALLFVVGGLAGVLLATLLVLAPLGLALPGSPLVEHALTRAYSGSSTGVYAVIGGLAGLATGWRRGGVLVAAVAWETGLWAFHFDWAELVSIYHYAALAVGYAWVRADWYGGRRAT